MCRHLGQAEKNLECHFDERILNNCWARQCTIAE